MDENSPAESPSESSGSADSAPQAASASKLSGLGWLVRVGVNSAAVLAVAALILVLIGVAQRSGWITADGFGGCYANASGDTTSGEPERYICTMISTPPSTEAGRCPVCEMELDEATGGGGGDGLSVTIEASARRLVVIQSAMS